MADKKLESITFPDLPDRYVVKPDIADVTGLQTALDGKADTNGTYDDMTVGNAKQLLSDMYVEDKEPFTFRTTGGSNNIGDRADMELVGWTGAWNQLIKNGNFADTNDWSATNGTLTASGNIGTFASSSSSNKALSAFANVIKDHKYIFSFDYKSTNSFSIQRVNGSEILPSASAFTNKSIIQVAGATAQRQLIWHDYSGSASWDLQLKNVVCTDLTALLGSTIADYIYTLETNQAGDGVAFFKKYFKNPYYAYCQPKLESVCVSAYGNNGFNQFDKDTIKTSEGAYILNDNGEKVADGSSSYFAEATKVMPNTAYYLLVNGDNVDGLQKLYYFDANDNFISRTGYVSSGVYTTPSNCYYIRYQYKVATVDTSKWCINLHWDGERDGQYEAYDQRNYPLDTVTLRGILKLDANNVPYADGDTYSADGTVTRRYGIVNLGSLSWNYKSDVTPSFFYAQVSGMVNGVTGIIPNIKIANYDAVASTPLSTLNTMLNNMTCSLVNGNNYVAVCNTNYTDAPTFTTAMNGVYLVYELATPTTESADPYTTPQIVDDWGTEWYTDYEVAQGNRDVAIPAGHNTKYLENLKADVEMVPKSPNGDGDYVMRQTSGQNAYVSLASTPTITDIISRLEALENA